MMQVRIGRPKGGDMVEPPEITPGAPPGPPGEPADVAPVVPPAPEPMPPTAGVAPVELIAQPATSALASQPVLITIGDIACTQTTVITPGGTYPLAGTVWMVSNNTTTTESIPTYAIILMILFVIFCLLGLLFLLIKEKRTQGFVQVSVQGSGLYHTVQLPAYSTVAVVQIEQQVSYVRSLVATLDR
jgi:hypothetical protein